MKNFQEKLHTWALNTVEVYKTIAEEEENTDFTSHTAFYTQSDLARLVSSPKIVVMAINPGSNGSYREQKININWNLDPKKGLPCKNLSAVIPLFGSRFQFIFIFCSR